MSTEIFGNETLDPFEGLTRSSFPSEGAYLAEAIRRQMMYDDPAYQKARQKVVRLRQEQLAAEAQARETAEFNKQLKNCVLPKQKQEEIRKKAADRAGRDFTSGRITAEAIEAQTKTYYAELERRAKIDYVSGQRFNAMFRAQFQGQQ